MKKKLLYLLIIVFIGFTSRAQFSKTHYIPPLSNSSSMNIGNKYIYISTPSITPISVQLKEIGGNTINATVSSDTPFVYNTNSGTNGQLFISENEINSILSNKGYIVEAEDVVYVSVRVDTSDGFQAGALVSKGLASLGTEFRIGGFLNTLMSNYSSIHHTFITVLATENNTEVNFSNIKLNASLINNPSGSTPFSIILNNGESFAVAVQGPNNNNRDALIGSLVTSDKPIVVNCGSIGGTNGELSNIDLGFDQIVDKQRIGNEYIFLKNTGQDNVERALLIANEDNTGIYINGDTAPSYTLSAGEYVALIGSDYSPDGILFVRSADANNITISKNVFAYQSVGVLNNTPNQRQANQEMFFVPPLSCQTPKVINNIPLIQRIGSRTFTGRVTLTTQIGSTLDFIINGSNYTLATLNSIGVVVQGPIAVTGNLNYECYILTGLSGNVAAYSTGELYLAAYGSDGAATFGGYYSGFTFNPEISFNRFDLTSANCIPNSVLTVNSLSPFDTFQWYFNGALTSETSGSLSPNAPGYYKVSATISGCGTPKESDNIPVSNCPLDTDNDNVNNNIDLDLDNDGITNCDESYGNQNLNLTNNPVGTIQVGNYTNTFSSTLSFAGTGTPSATPFVGNADGNFTTEAVIGKENTVSYDLNFNNPLSLSLEYATTAIPTDLLTSATEIRITCPVNKTLTVLNPDDQILIDTNFDGIYETGVTQFSSFEIRFRLNGNVSLASGTGTFSIRGNEISELKISNINLTDDQISRVALHVTATCVEKDSDNDGIPDQYDYDSDNDSIPDWVESQGQNVVTISGFDSNLDGIDDIFGNGITPANSDNDSVPNYLDLDSDNDGIFDIVESGSTGNGNNTSGIVIGNVGANGLLNSLETSPNSGIINYTLADSDADGIYNYIEIDSDGDGCLDTIEAGYVDNNNDGVVGDDSPVNTDPTFGLVIAASGYSVPNVNYTITAPLAIENEPVSRQVCELSFVTFTVNSTTADSYRWQISIDGGTTWTNITNNATNAGATTNALTVSNVIPATPNHQYRAFLNRVGNSCGLYSTVVELTTFPLPVITTPIDLKQCDNDTDGISVFNLTQKNDFISANAANETFTYYSTAAGATTENAAALIANPTAYTSGTGAVFVRVENSNGCIRVATINIVVSVTQIPASYVIPIDYSCDDYIDVINDDFDGISAFDFSQIETDLLTFLPNNVTVSFYKNEADFLAETDTNGNSLAIQDISNYRNTDYPFQQTLWVRADSTLDNSCYGFKTFEINVVPWPRLDLEETILICLPDTQTTIDAGIIDGKPITDFTYQWYTDGNLLTGENSYSLTVNTDATYTVDVSSIYGCTKTRTIKVIGSEIASLESIQISDLTQINTVLINVTGLGDYEYALDDIIGPYRSSNFFTNVPMGLHDVYIRDVNGCGILGPLQIAVLGIPQYFTPNGDGFNDTWNVKGINATNVSSIIYIFDRFGKLIKQISAISDGWDGSYNGYQLPADDYWYNIQFQDGRNARGHFSLKR